MLIDQKDSVRALRAVHGRFYLATLPLGVGIIGPGLIGSTFLDQIYQQIAVRLVLVSCHGLLTHVVYISVVSSCFKCSATGGDLQADRLAQHAWPCLRDVSLASKEKLSVVLCMKLMTTKPFACLSAAGSPNCNFGLHTSAVQDLARRFNGVKTQLVSLALFNLKV